jgi:hypothetical protein
VSTIPGFFATVDPATGNLVINRQALPNGPVEHIETFAGVNASNNGRGISIANAATSYTGSPTVANASQITSNVTNPNGTSTINLGGGYTVTPSASNPHQGTLCDASGSCVKARIDGGQVTASLSDTRTVTANLGTTASANPDGTTASYGTNGVTNVQVYNALTGQTTNVTSATSTPNNARASGR